MNNIEKTIANFKTMNCNQSVLTTFGPDFGISEEMCFSIGLSYGGGMGKQGKTCGAVTGAYTVIGLWCSKQTSDKGMQKQLAEQKVKEFNEHFEKEHGSLDCKPLLNYDLSVKSEAEKANALGLFDSLCPKLVGSSASILNHLFS